MIVKYGICVSALAFFLVHCGDGGGGISATLGFLEQPEQWSEADRPSVFPHISEYNINLLPSQGTVAKLPWPGSYWPMRADSINYRWDGTNSLSAAEKYEKAFSVHGVQDAVSAYKGVDSGRVACTTSVDCPSSEFCGKRRGHAQGYCHVSWSGICNGWSAAALHEPEPVDPVTVNGVEFRPNDIKALMTLRYAKVGKRILAKRCNASDIEVDAAGRPIDERCRDNNAGTFHVVITNLVGLRGLSFVADWQYSYAVWNHPIHGYRLLRNQAISERSANELVGGSGPSYEFSASARGFRNVRMEVKYTTESSSGTDGSLLSRIDSYTVTKTLEYVLELDGDGNVIGGEWVGSSQTGHPDFLWLPMQLTGGEVARISYTKVRSLLMASVDKTSSLNYVDKSLSRCEPELEQQGLCEPEAADHVACVEFTNTHDTAQIVCDVAMRLRMRRDSEYRELKARNEFQLLPGDFATRCFEFDDPYSGWIMNKFSKPVASCTTFPNVRAHCDMDNDLMDGGDCGMFINKFQR